MKVGIIGLGLMGGSLAKAISFGTEHTVWGTNRSPEAVQKALFVGAIEKELTNEDLNECDLVIVSLYPQASIDYIIENAKNFKKDAIVMDISGVKRYVCDELCDSAKENGFVFLGAHPMAGLHLSGFEHSTGTWICYGFLHFSYLMMIFTPFIESKEYISKTTSYTISSLYFEIVFYSFFCFFPIF